MASCEKCWGEAYFRTRLFGGFQADHYRDLIAEHDVTGDHESGEPE